MTSFARAYFAYGTLRPGSRYWTNVAAYVAQYDPAYIDGFDLYDLPEGYPAIVAGTGRVFGDLLYVRTGEELAMARVADDIEDFDEGDPGSLYLRRQVLVTRLRGPQLPAVPAVTYVFNPHREATVEARGVRVPEGDWREFVAERDGA